MLGFHSVSTLPVSTIAIPGPAPEDKGSLRRHLRRKEAHKVDVYTKALERIDEIAETMVVNVPVITSTPTPEITLPEIDFEPIIKRSELLRARLEKMEALTQESQEATQRALKAAQEATVKAVVHKKAKKIKEEVKEINRLAVIAKHKEMVALQEIREIVAAERARIIEENRLFLLELERLERERKRRLEEEEMLVLLMLMDE